MARLIGVLALLVGILLGGGSAFAVEPLPVVPVTFSVHDAPEYNQPASYTSTELGPPPIAYESILPPFAVRGESSGVGPVRFSRTVADAYTTYDLPVSLADNCAPATQEVAQNANGDLPSLHPGLFAAEGVSGAGSALNGARLREHLSQLEKYGQAGVRELESGRIRYYGEISPARKPGEMVGRRLAREWDPATGNARTWHETVDGSGRVRIVRPETGGSKTHYTFDESGGSGGSW